MKIRTRSSTWILFAVWPNDRYSDQIIEHSRPVIGVSDIYLVYLRPSLESTCHSYHRINRSYEARVGRIGHRASGGRRAHAIRCSGQIERDWLDFINFTR